MARKTVKKSPTRGVIYGRQSRTKMGSESLDTQVEACKETAQFHGIEVVDTILEPPSTSAFKSRGRARPRFPEVLELIRSGAVDVVVAYKTDRLSRGGGIGWAPLVEAAEDAGLDVDRFVLIAGNGFMSEFELGIRATMDREESKKTSERLCDMKDKHAAAGRPWGGGARPFGYQYDLEAKNLVVDETEAVMIREAVHRLFAGEGQNAICRSWNEAGRPTAGGKEWRPGTLRNTLLRASIAGLREHHGEILGQATWDPIIDRPTWERVRAYLLDPSRKRVESYRTSLLTGLARCGLCDAKLVVAPTQGRNAYRCQKGPGKPACGGVAIVADPLEELVVAAALKVLADPGLEDALAEEHRPDISVPADVTDDETKLAELAAMWAAGDVTRGEWMVARQTIEERIERRLEEVRRHRPALSRPSSLLRLEPDLAAAWEAMSHEDRRGLLADVINTITIQPARRGLNRFDGTRVDVDWVDRFRNTPV